MRTEAHLCSGRTRGHMWLSRSRIIAGWQCLKRSRLEVHQPESAAGPKAASNNTQRLPILFAAFPSFEISRVENDGIQTCDPANRMPAALVRRYVLPFSVFRGSARLACITGVRFLFFGMSRREFMREV